MDLMWLHNLAEFLTSSFIQLLSFAVVLQYFQNLSENWMWIPCVHQSHVETLVPDHQLRILNTQYLILFPFEICNSCRVIVFRSTPFIKPESAGEFRLNEWPQ